MNFSEVLRVCGGGGECGGSVVCWSPDGLYVAWPSTNSRLEIRDANTLQVLVTHTCTDVIQDIQWAENSQLILTASYKRGVVEVWSISDTKWRCKIEEGTAGLIKVRWAPDGRHLLTTAEFNLQITIWSLVNKGTSYIRDPKSISTALSFSPDKDYLIVAKRRNCKDSLSLFETKSWHLVKNFPVCTRDLAGVVWGGRGSGGNVGSVVAVWDAPTIYKVAIYTLYGHCLKVYSPCDLLLGVKEVKCSPSGQFLAVAGLDNKVRLLRHLTWGVISEYPHPPTITSPSCTVYREVRTQVPGFKNTLPTNPTIPPLPMETVEYQEEVQRPITLTTLPATPQPHPNNPPPLLNNGIHTLSFSSDGRFLATVRGDLPTIVWIWDVAKSCLKSVLVQEDVVKDISWDPRYPRLAVCTGGCHLYFWTPLGTVAVTVPNATPININTLRWHPFGRSLILGEKKYLVVCHLEAPPRPPR